jgi:hypothetical protein
MGNRVVSTRRMAARVSWAQCRDFKGRDFTAEVILWAVRWYLMSRSVLSALAPPPLADKGSVGYRAAPHIQGRSGWGTVGPGSFWHGVSRLGQAPP